MTSISNLDHFSPLRAELASFERCYAVAVCQRMASGRSQFVVRTGDPFRPFRVSTQPPGRGERLTTLIA